RRGIDDFAAVNPLHDGVDHPEHARPSRRGRAARPPEPPAFLDGQPRRQHRVVFRDATRAAAFGVKFFAVETEPGNAELHGYFTYPQRGCHARHANLANSAALSVTRRRTQRDTPLRICCWESHLCRRTLRSGLIQFVNEYFPSNRSAR